MMGHGKASRLYRPRATSGIIALGRGAYELAAGGAARTNATGFYAAQMRALLHAEIAALLDRAGVNRAAFARPA